jgi:hypothetical protein
VTIVADILPTGWGGSNAGRILTNGKIVFNVSNATPQFTSDGSTTVSGAASSLALNKRTRLVVTRTAAGVANIYVQGSLSGSANQNSGTPAAGTSLLTTGNRVAGDRAFKGWIKEVRVYTNDIWSEARVSQDYADWSAGL